MSAPSRSPAARFLVALGRLVRTVSLYPARHPARTEAVRTAHEALLAVLADRDPAVFSFLEDEVVFGDEPLRDIGAWPWSPRLFGVGVQRLEVVPGVGAEELEAFAAELTRRLGLVVAEPERGPAGLAPAASAGRLPHLRFGELRIARAVDEETEPAEVSPLHLEEEAKAVRWIHEMAAREEEAPEEETAAIVSSLLVAVRSARKLLAPLLQLQGSDHYTSTHCLNVSLLSMSLGEYLSLSDEDVRAIGEAGLLHDIGKVRIPSAILNKPGELTPEERAVVEHHVVEGARMLLRSEERDGLSAIVAYEHHMHWQEGGGYPRLSVAHTPHRFSRLVQVCDVYDALRSPRPWRGPLAPEAALTFLDRRSGSEFDPEMVSALGRMMREWEPHLLERGAEPEEETDSGELEARVERSETGFDADTEANLFVS